MTTLDSRLQAVAPLQAGTMSGSGADTADTTPPQLVSSPGNAQPADGDLVFTFSEAIKAGSGKFTLTGPSPFGGPIFSGDVANSAAITISGNTLTVHLPQRLDYATEYGILLDAHAVTDLAGNPYASTTTSFYFRSGLSPAALHLTGGDGADTLHGSDLADTLSGGGGPDTLYGYGGDDLINGGDEVGNIMPYSGDHIDGGAGNDTVFGDNGNDQLSGGDGNDQLFGGDGHDWISGGAGDDLLDGGAGNDTLNDDTGQNMLRGGDGDDELTSGTGAGGLLDGGIGNDTLSGTDGVGFIGGAGNDRITLKVWSVNGPATTVDAGDGDDRIDFTLYPHTTAHVRIIGGAGVDTYVLHQIMGPPPDGSARVDVLDFKPGAGGDVIDVLDALAYNNIGNPFANGWLKLVADGNDTLLQLKMPNFGTYQTLLHLDNVLPGQLTSDNFVGGIDPAGSSKGLTLTGTDGADALTGNLMDDMLFGLGGNDTLNGAGGNNALDGGAGNDVLYGGPGNDTLSGGPDNDTLTDNSGNNTLLGGDGNDNLTSGSTGSNLFDGGAGNDTIQAGSGSHTLLGGDGDDTIQVSGTYPGTLHSVSVAGGEGKDLLLFSADPGATISASGGNGADTFKFAAGADWGSIAITDFSPAQGDKLDLLDLLPRDLASNPFGAAGYLKATQAGSDVAILLDRDGAAGNDYMPFTLVMLKNIELAALPASAFAGGLDPAGGTKGMLLAGSPGADNLAGGWLDDTIGGGDGKDSIDGGPGNDLIDGGDESVLGAGDFVFGGAGNDTIHGGVGFDTLQGDAGNDSLAGDDGNDELIGGLGNDTLDGGAGNDALYDNQGTNVLHDGAGNDTLDVITPRGYNVANPGLTHGDSTLDGGDGDDYLHAGRGNDVLYGGAGNDTLDVTMIAGGPQHVTIDGGDGDDTIYITNSYAITNGAIDTTSKGATIEATGGAGRDTYQFANDYLTSLLTITDFQPGRGGDILDVLSLMRTMPTANPFGALGYLRLVADGADTLVQYDRDGAAGPADFVAVAVLKNVAPASLTADNFPQGIRPDGSSTGMAVVGTDLGDSIPGGLLDDTIDGGGGNDTIDGGLGANLIHGNDGDDHIQVADGKSQLFGDAGNDALNGSWDSAAVGGDTLSGGAGNDTLQTWHGDNVMNGDDGDDILFASSGGHNHLSGGAGSDVLTSNGGADILDGGDGDDKLTVTDNAYPYSWTSPDVRTVQLEGGSGRDQLTVGIGEHMRTSVVAHGGADSDTFIVAKHPLQSTITIADFQAGAGGDLIDLSGLVTGIKNPFAPGGALLLVQRGADTVIQADPDGSGALGMTDVLTLTNVAASTLRPDNFWNGFNPDGSNVGLTLTGTGGAETLAGGALDDTLAGGLGNDSLTGSFGNDSIDGGDGDDTLSGDQSTEVAPYLLWFVRAGDDKLSGGAGNDRLVSYSGNDTLDGGAGNDTLLISDMSYPSIRDGDRVVARGGDGDDFIHVDGYLTSALSVTMSGGAGQDTYSLPSNIPGLTLTITDFQAGAGGDVLDVFGSYWAGTTPFSSGEFRFVQRGADAVLQHFASGSPNAAPLEVLTLQNVDWTKLTPENTMGWPIDGSTKGLVIPGTDDDDSLTGSPLDDTITGGLGNDTITGLNGTDVIYGGPGNDRIEGSYRGGTLYGDDGDDVLDVGLGGGGAFGGAGNDHLSARNGTVTLDGGDGDDIFEVDPVQGGGWAHDITLLGGAGNDIFYVTEWADANNPIAATGGAGRDVFEVGSAYSGYGSRYTVTDFQAGANGDSIALGDLMKTVQAGANPFADGHLRLLQSGSDTLLQYDYDGSANPYGSFQTLLTLNNVQASAITADNFVEHVDPHPSAPAPAPAPVPVPVPTPAPAPAPAPAGPPASSAPPTAGVIATGGDSTDQMAGSDHDDNLDAGAGDDVLHGGGGNDLLVGGAGRDTATYDAKLANYTITHDGSNWHVEAKTGGDGYDTLQGVERLHFADQDVALDLDGDAAQAYRIYRAAFDRTPDKAGLGFWISTMDKGATVHDLAYGFVHSQEFTDLYGSAPSNADIVGKLYQNILHRAPDQAGYDYWLGVLDSKQADLVSVLGFFSESAENQDAVASLIAGGIVFAPWGG